MKDNIFRNDEHQIAQTIPKGFTFVEGTESTGLVIQDKAGNRYVCVPGGENADGLYVSRFYISQFEISKGEDGMPMSQRGKKPWGNITFFEAVKTAIKVNGSLISGQEYSRMCFWLYESGAVTFHQMFEDGKDLGNYNNSYELMETGSNDEWVHNNIYDVFGNGFIWTTERFDMCSHNRVIRSGNKRNNDTGVCAPPISRAWEIPDCRRKNLTFRIVLHLEEEDED